MKRTLFILVTVLVSLYSYADGTDTIFMTIIYDNYVFKEGTTSDWGFACFIEGTEKTILFDAGLDGQILLDNADYLGIDFSKIDAIVISHNHQDHTGGLNSALGRKSNVSVYLGNSYFESYSQSISNYGATPVRVDESVEICENVYSTGELQGSTKEQSLIIDTEEGLVIITGCSHPGIVNILNRAQQVIDKNIYMVFGGFHLLDHSNAQINSIIQEFETLGVEKCGATHCTGDNAIALFKEAYGENYIPMGVGQVIQVPDKFTTNIKESENGLPGLPNIFKLSQNYPNTFGTSTIIPYTIYRAAPVELKIFNLAGQEVETLIHTYQTAGYYNIVWQPEGLLNGTYLYRLQVGKSSETKKLILLN